MKKSEFYLRSTNGYNNLHCVTWKMESSVESPVAIFQIVHGMTEYINRYDEFARYLSKKGIIVIGHDQLGHGSSVNYKSELGYFYKEEGGKYLIKDIDKVRRYAQKKYGEKVPYYILGHSMGSFCLRQYLCVYGQGITGAVIMGSGIVPTIPVLFARNLVKVLERKYGGYYKSELVKNILFKGYLKEIENPVSNSDWLSRDREIVDKYDNDPLCNFDFTLRAYDDFLSVLEYISKKDNCLKIPRDIRILITSGDKDPVGNMGKGVNKLFDDFDKNYVEDVTLSLYIDHRHEILNELGRENIYRDILEWIVDTE